MAEDFVVVDVPGVGEVEFPVSMGERQIEATVHRLYLDSQIPDPREQEHAGVGGVLRSAATRLMEGPEPGQYPLVTGTPPAAAPFGLPAGRMAKVALGGVLRAGSRLPVVGPVARNFVEGAREAWKATAPKPPWETGGTMPNLLQRTPRGMPQIATPTPPPGPGPASLGAIKPKLSAPEVAQMLRQQYGSSKAGQMLFGPAQRGALSAAARQEAIKRLAPMESQLPQAAQRAIQQRLGQGGPTDEMWSYISRAPNDRAREYLISLMKSQ